MLETYKNDLRIINKSKKQTNFDYEEYYDSYSNYYDYAISCYRYQLYIC
ncbi:protein of unknown function [Candidatus Nitrosocosmicus franklandus]|uniref:Uncharacterized protein n=1 Tax=Candidatus Nitrosocosmicus franklandianus TaxID=1798806 RepID=A0A484I7R2_9ARCH|nr:protein of unknown function [Candidatus Nitrosocosmicus franklandus]